MEYEAKTIWQEGIKEGRREGMLHTLFELIQKHRLTVSEAAEQAGMSESAFLEKMNLHGRDGKRISMV